MWTMLTSACDTWATVYQNSAALRTSIGFAHIAGLVVGGGCAIAEDRAILIADDAALEVRRAQVRRAHDAAHGVVIGGLAAVMFSGLLLFAADVQTYLGSTPFWIKMGLVAALLVNGWLMTRAETALAASASAWPRLRLAAITSIALWLTTTLAGTALPNV